MHKEIRGPIVKDCWTCDSEECRTVADRGDAQPGLDGTPALELAQFSNDETMSASTLSIVIGR